ncbi:MAG: hypothetical protein Ct9H300mP6_11750 [Gammaproteobacteria bacterium]|nr:MAG: hypothetical protein Ct9H300mP6_11750 [Gammaproteobacteria bacterium]
MSTSPKKHQTILLTDPVMQDSILILDFGSQYTQLIARRVREAGVYSEIYAGPKHQQIKDFNPSGIIFSGGLSQPL